MGLSGNQTQMLTSALTSAYPSYADFDMMLQFKVNRRLANLAAPGPLPRVIWQVLQAAEAEGWTDDLVTGARLANPGNPDLKALVESGLLSISTVALTLSDDPANVAARTLVSQGGMLEGSPRTQLESIVQISSGFHDVWPWVTKLLEQASRVCRAEVVTSVGTTYGTGFLVGADLVLTNHHVLANVINRSTSSKAVKFRFDYRILPDDSFDDGILCSLAPGDNEAWLLASSPPSDFDSEPEPGGLPGPDELDFALVRVDGAIGTAPAPGLPARGWMRVQPKTPQLAAGQPMLIIQHPDREPVKLAQSNDGVIKINDNQTRVTHRVNTLGGSSGSPCLNFDLELVALHHAGETRFSAGRNEAIPISTIASKLSSMGVEGAL